MTTDARDPRPPGDLPRPPRRHRRLAASGGVRGDGRPGLQPRADRRCRRRHPGPHRLRGRGARRPGRAWPPARSRWRRGSTPRSPASPRPPQREIDKERREIIAQPGGRDRRAGRDVRREGHRPGARGGGGPADPRDVDNAVAVHAREELGVDPDDLASPMVAAVSSFLSFAVGALIPRAALPARRGQPGPRAARDPARAVRLRRRRHPGDQPVLVVRRLCGRCCWAPRRPA